MFILKYKVGDDTFYRISAKQQPSGKSIAFDRPLTSHSLTSKIESSLKTIDSILAVKEEPRLKEGIDCLVKFEKEGYFFSDKEKEILLNIFNKYNDN